MTRVLILINRLSNHPTADELDVIDQTIAVEESLDELGFQHERIYVDANLDALVRKLSAERGSIAFNLVESINGSGGLVHFIPALLESLDFPFTGNPSAGMFLTTHKPLAKRIMTGNGIPTPAWFPAAAGMNLLPGRKYIVKPSREDASVGIDDENVFDGKETAVLEKFRERWGNQFFVEEFIDGREFNLSMLGGPGGSEVLAPAEIVFNGFPAGKPAIVGYSAKWDENTFEYRNTVRTFDFPESDGPLIDRLRVICHQCWQVFGLRGHVRVDFRVDAEGNPFVLEINANPCIAPDSGFFNAALRSGYPFSRVVQRLLEDR
jgi:D-alanine-D-alanine ligase